MAKPQLNVDLINEAPFVLVESLRHIPQATSVQQVRNWAYHGVFPNRYKRMINLKRYKVRLECVQLPDGLGTSYAAYIRFIEELNK